MNDWIVSKVLSAEAQSVPQTGDKVGGKDDVIHQPEINITPPITEYERIKNHPYIYDYLKLKDSGISHDALYEAHYKPNLKEIEKYVVGEIKRTNLKPTVESYNQIMDRIKTYLSIGDNDMPDKVINNIKTYISVIKTQRKLKDKYQKTLDQLNSLKGEEQ